MFGNVFADANTFVGHTYVQAVCVALAMYRHGTNAHFTSGTNKYERRFRRG